MHLLYYWLFQRCKPIFWHKMTPPRPGKSDTNQEDSAASRTYYRERYSNSRNPEPETQDTSDSHNSKYWDSYGYGLRDNYGYDSHSYNRDSYDYRDDYYPPLPRTGGGGQCGPVPGYRQAFMDPSFALGLFVVGAFATYVLFNALETANAAGTRRELSPILLLEGFMSGKK